MATPTLDYRPLGLKLRGEELDRYREFVAERDARYARGEADPAKPGPAPGSESAGVRRLRLRAEALARAFAPGSTLTYDQIRAHLEATGRAAGGASGFVCELRKLGLFPYQIQAKRAGPRKRRDLVLGRAS